MHKKSIALIVTLLFLCIASTSTLNTALAAEPNYVATSNKRSAEVRYADAQVFATRASESFSFTSREELDFVFTPGNAPKYDSAGYVNSCGPVAGANIIGYYDKYFENLIPNYVTYYTSTGKYKSKDSVNIPATINSLYTLMRTNIDGDGVTEAEFLTGLTQYVENHNQSISYSNAYSNGTANYNFIKSSIQEGKVLVLFSQACNISDIYTSGNTELLYNVSINAPHIMVIFGCYSIKYTFANGSSRIDNYVAVSTGLSQKDWAYFKLNSASNIIDIKKITIS